MATVHAPLVYYAKRGPLIKIGTTTQFRVRMYALDVEEVLAVEPGSYDVEERRHAEFAECHSHDEWFHATPELLSHAAALRLACEIPAFSRPKRVLRIKVSPGAWITVPADLPAPEAEALRVALKGID